VDCYLNILIFFVTTATGYVKYIIFFKFLPQYTAARLKKDKVLLITWMVIKCLQICGLHRLKNVRNAGGSFV
jgi:hypothetical protein